MAACCSRSVPEAMKCCCVKDCSRPRTLETAIWASLIVAGPCFLALLSGACHLVSRCVAQQLHSNNSVDLPRGPSVVAYICITTWIFDSLICWCIKGLYCCMSMTRSKLSLLQDSFGDNILTWQHFFSSKNMWFVCLKNYVILCTLVMLLPRFDMP